MGGANSSPGIRLLVSEHCRFLGAAQALERSIESLLRHMYMQVWLCMSVLKGGCTSLWCLKAYASVCPVTVGCLEVRVSWSSKVDSVWDPPPSLAKVAGPSRRIASPKPHLQAK